MMEDKDKTKKQLINELVELRHRISAIEQLGIRYENAKKERDRFFNFSIDMFSIAGFDGYFKELNPSWEKTLGWTKEELQSKPYVDLVHPEDRESTINATKGLEEGKTTIAFENRYLCKDGSYKWISWNSFPLIEEKLIFAVARDISEQKEAEEELKRVYDELEIKVNVQTAELRRQTEDLLKEKAFTENALNTLKDVFFVFDLKGRFLRGNTAINEVSDYSDKEISSMKPTDFFIKEDIERIEEAINKIIKEGYASIEVTAVTKDGKHIPFEFIGNLLKDYKGIPIGICGVGRDITDRKILDEKLKQCISYDILTGLPNRVLFLDYLKAAMARADRQEGYKFAVVVFNVDRFKNIIDSLGHFAGDKLLIEVATRLKKHLRAYDTVARLEYEAVARLGGDEFAVLLSDIKNIRTVINVIERLHEAIKIPIKINDDVLNITVSTGVTVSNSTYERPEDILRDADTAMFKAKTLGKNRYMIFDEDMHTQAVSYLQLENSLQQAIERNQFLLNYQPIVLVETDEIVGFEALLRWESPERGLVSPNEIIPLAEETGLIIPIGRWVLHEACRQMHSWHRLFPAYSHLTVSVNTSIKQYTVDLMKTIKQILNETGFNPACLKLEITESVIINNPEPAVKIFSQLRDMNIKIQIDDFGTGYSSLGYLNRFSFDALKIDKSFVKSMCGNELAMEIVKTIITMAHNMKMDVIAEGVETVEQLEELRKLKCDYYQGYWFSKPLAWTDAEALIDRII
ncbi:MAG: EAL domain-containing protein [Thermodesulfovibrionales bacterium]|jgi:diguanylate cyclase (GGDEF)-like protein/PAS domain S-box-containing protein